jgi:hypothetical protein
VVCIEYDKRASCGEACEHPEREQRACRQQDGDQVAGFGVGRQCFGEP